MCALDERAAMENFTSMTRLLKTGKTAIKQSLWSDQQGLMTMPGSYKDSPETNTD
jgi:hypothetical protein